MERSDVRQYPSAGFTRASSKRQQNQYSDRKKRDEARLRDFSFLWAYQKLFLQDPLAAEAFIAYDADFAESVKEDEIYVDRSRRDEKDNN